MTGSRARALTAGGHEDHCECSFILHSGLLSSDRRLVQYLSALQKFVACAASKNLQVTEPTL